MGRQLVRRCFQKYWRHLVLVLTPLLLLPLPIVIGDQKSLCGYLLLLMAVFWVTEALPLGVTGLLPLFLSPMLGLMSLNDVAPNYMKANTVSFFASIVCALAIEKSGLHRRIALRILLGLGTRIRWLMLGFMIPAFLLSWFVVNTASVATMMPLLEAVLEQLDPDRNPDDNPNGNPDECKNPTPALSDSDVNGKPHESLFKATGNPSPDSRTDCSSGSVVEVGNHGMGNRDSDCELQPQVTWRCDEIHLQMADREQREIEDNKEMQDEVTWQCDEIRNQRTISDTSLNLSSQHISGTPNGSSELQCLDRERRDGHSLVFSGAKTDVKCESACNLTFYGPIVTSKGGSAHAHYGGDVIEESNIRESGDGVSMETKRKEYQNLAKGLTLCCCYAANAGGIATLTGSTPNLILKQSVDDYYASKGESSSPVNYATWMVYGVPIAVLAFCLLWLWLQVLYANCRDCGNSTSGRSHSERSVRRVLRQQYGKLGRMRYEEGMVLFLFVALVLLWFFRAPGFMPGWGERFPKGYVGTAVPAVLVSVAMFIIPSRIPSRKVLVESGPPDTIMTWQTVHRKMSWGLILMVGGGYALADAMEASGLASWIADQLTVLGEWPEFPMMLVLCLAVALLTEVTSNPATCTLMMPIVSNMAEQLGKNPLYLMLPSCVCSSFAFMLPVAAPPNALAFAYGHLKVLDMVKAGSLANVFCVLIVTLATLTWGRAYFDLDHIPWSVSNVTMTTEALNPAFFHN